MAKKIKMIQCPHCGALNPKGNKICKECNQSLKGPIYKRKWFIALIVVFVLFGFASVMGGGSSSDSSDSSETATETTESKKEEKISYTKYDVTDLFDDLEKNALKAEKKHQDEYVEITGYITNIDSDGAYIDIGAKDSNYDYMFQQITCYVSGDDEEEQQNTIMELEDQQKVVVKGQITEIGEVIGYHLDMDSIKAK